MTPISKRRPKENRRHIRIRTRAWVQALYKGEQHTLRDLSPTGTFLRMKKPPKEGEKIRLRLQSVRLSKDIELKATVHRSIPNHGMGVSFVFLKEEDQFDLGELLSQLVVPRILIVDEDEKVRRNLTRLFNKEDYAVLTADDGHEGLHLAADSQLDLIVLDMDNTKPEGLEVLQQLKKMPHLSRVPILVLSVSNDPAIFSNAQRLGAAGCIPKPIQQQKLLHFARMMLEW